MTASTRSCQVLTCDNCGASIDNAEAGVTGTTPLRLWAAQQGWRYVQTMVPIPEPSYRGKGSVRRSWDFCGQCGVPDRLQTSVNQWHGRGWDPVKVTIVGGLFVYGDEPE